MQNPLSVSELNAQIKALLETTFLNVYVAGEVSNLTYHGSGHVYFSIKDRDSTLKCVLFKGNAARLKFRLENGQSVEISGALSVYIPRGDYQIICNSINPSGIGALSLAYNQLKEKLEKKGYFDRSIKKSLPRFVSHIAIVTSPTGAAIEDMRRVAEKRWKLLKITLIETLVQGEAAKYDIAKNIAFADSLGADVLIVGRGGGSIEDLWAFNEEIVADAIYKCKTPVVSAVGHEVDYLISDFVADVRAPTPSAAMETVLPDMNTLLLDIDEHRDRLQRYFANLLVRKAELLQDMGAKFAMLSVENRIKRDLEHVKIHLHRFDDEFMFILKREKGKIAPVFEKLGNIFINQLNVKGTLLASLEGMYESNDPTKRLKKGFAQVIKGKKPVTLGEIEAGEYFTLEDSQYSIKAKAEEKNSII